MNDLKTVRDDARFIYNHFKKFASDRYVESDKEYTSDDLKDKIINVIKLLNRMIETPAPQGLPSEPTEEIINAIHDAISGDIEGYDGQQMDWYAKIYKAMLSAAPTPAPTAVDLENLHEECIAYASRDWRSGAWGYTEGEIVVDTIKHLAAKYDFVRKV